MEKTHLSAKNTRGNSIILNGDTLLAGQGNNTNHHQQRKLTTRDHWEIVAEGDWLTGQRFKISGHTVLGRDAHCDITIPGTHLSRQHAELAIQGNTLLIRDLNSSNGTYVNQQRITETALKPGDIIRFDVLTFRVHGPDDGLPLSTHTATTHPSAIKDKPPRPASKTKHSKPQSAALDNRDNTVIAGTKQPASNALWILMAIVVGATCLLGVGFLVMHL